MIRTLRAALAAALLGTVALAAQADDAKPAGEKTPYSDEMFVKKAAVSGMFEVQSSKLAVKMSETKSVKQFAEHMIKDHSKANKELMAVAKKAGLTAPKQLDAEHMKKVEALKGLTGQAFDKQYTQDQLVGHEKAVALFETATQHATNPGVKAFATKTLPTLKEHLEMLKKHSDK